MSNPCQLYLITPPLAASDLEAFAPKFKAALSSGLASSALARIAPGAEGDGKRIVARLAEIAVASDVALLVEGDIRLAARAGGAQHRIVLRGDMPSPAHTIPGCPFHPRCHRARARCATEVPALRELAPGHCSACHFAEEM